MYVLPPPKGTIAIGSDADLALWDPDRDVTITNDLLHHNAVYTPYEEMPVRGWPVTTISRGATVWGDGNFLGRQGLGQFLRCDRPAPARPGRPPSELSGSASSS